MTNRTGEFHDTRDGYVYRTVTIAGQQWFAENLRYLPFLNSAPDGRGNVSVLHYKGDDLEAARQTVEYRQYGCLYDWNAAMTLCPPGWHLPSGTELETLLEALGGNSRAVYQQLIPSGRSGFNALCGGWRNDAGEWCDLERMGFFWSSTEEGDLGAYALDIYVSTEGASLRGRSKKRGFSIRCVAG